MDRHGWSGNRPPPQSTTQPRSPIRSAMPWITRHCRRSTDQDKSPDLHKQWKRVHPAKMLPMREFYLIYSRVSSALREAGRFRKTLNDLTTEILLYQNLG